MFFIIDGTGEESDAKYFNEMKVGFCFNLFCKLNNLTSIPNVGSSIDSNLLPFIDEAVYMRGPPLSGWNTFNIANSMLKNHILPYLKGYHELHDSSGMLKLPYSKGGSPERKSIFLVGHSRGGAAVIYIAYKLLEIKINVEAMFLFDAVDRTVNSYNRAWNAHDSPYDLEYIPENIKTCYHAFRDKSLQNYFEPSQIPKKIISSGTFRTSGTYGPSVAGGNVRFIEDERAIKLKKVDKDMRVIMRNEIVIGNDLSIPFGNCGIKSKIHRSSSDIDLFKDLIFFKNDSRPIFETKTFLGSHGAIGGSSSIVNRGKKTKVVLRNKPVYRSEIYYKALSSGFALEEEKEEVYPSILYHNELAAIASVNSWMSENLHKEGILLGRNIIG